MGLNFYMANEEKKQSLLHQGATMEKIHRKWTAIQGRDKEMSDLEAEVDDSLAPLYLLSKGFSYETILKTLGLAISPITAVFSECERSQVAANSEGHTQWEKKSFYEIVQDVVTVANTLHKLAMANFDPRTDEFVLLVSVSRMQYLSNVATTMGMTVRDYIHGQFAGCKVRVLPDLVFPDKDDDGVLWAVAKVCNRYFCVRSHGI